MIESSVVLFSFLFYSYAHHHHSSPSQKVPTSHVSTHLLRIRVINMSSEICWVSKSEDLIVSRCDNSLVCHINASIIYKDTRIFSNKFTSSSIYSEQFFLVQNYVIRIFSLLFYVFTYHSSHFQFILIDTLYF